MEERRKENAGGWKGDRRTSFPTTIMNRKEGDGILEDVKGMPSVGHGEGFIKETVHRLKKDKTMEMKDRIRQLMESNHMTQKVFAQYTGISEASLSGVFNGRTKPSLSMVESIHERMPNVSVDWLMFGSGEMYTSQTEAAPADAPTLFGADGQPADDTSEVATQPATEPVVSSGNVQQQKTVVKFIDKPQRRITEIRIFYDDQTWETFVPKDR